MDGFPAKHALGVKPALESGLPHKPLQSNRRPHSSEVDLNFATHRCPFRKFVFRGSASESHEHWQTCAFAKVPAETGRKC
jgi:hypothetical protein